MIRFGIAQWCLDWDGVAALYRAATLGFTAIQIDAGEPGGAPLLSDPSVQRAYLQAADETSVTICGIAVNILNTHGMTSPPGSAGSRRCHRAIEQAIDAAHAMSVPLVFLPSFDNGEIRDTGGLATTAAVLREACAYAQERGVLLATENSLGAAENIQLLTAVGNPLLRVLIDSLNPVLWGHAVGDLIRTLYPYMCNQFHAKDGVNGEMGNALLNTGEANFADTARLLRSLGYDGYVILENEYAQETQARVAQDIAVLTQLFR